MGRAYRILSCLALMLALGSAAAAAADAERARSFLSEGKKLLAAGDTAAAIIQFRNAAANDPANGETHYHLGRAMTQQRGQDPRVAEEELRRAATNGYDKDRVDAALAELFIRQERYGEVLDIFPEGNRAKDLEARIRVSRGYSEINLRRPKDAERAFAEAIELAQSGLAEARKSAESQRGADATKDAERAFAEAIALSRSGLAQARIIANDLPAAADLLEKALQVQPQMLDSWLLLGRVRAWQSDAARAREAFDKAIAIDPYSIVGRLSRAALVIDSDEKQARADLDILLGQAPDEPRGNLLDAVLKARAGNWSGAQAALMMIPAPEHLPKALFMLARVGLALGQIGQAEASINQYLALAPKDAAGIAVRASVIMRRGKPAGAVDVLRRALIDNPDNIDLLGLLSEAYALNGQKADAAATLDRLAALAPKDAATRLRLAEQRITVGRVADALIDLQIARAAEPLSPQATTLAVQTLLSANRVDEAAALAEDLGNRAPESPVPETLLGIVAMRKGGAAEARAHFEKALALQPNFATAAINLALTYRAERRFDDARAVYDRSIKIEPKKAELMVARADLEFAADKAADGIAWLERARTADPHAVPPRLHLLHAYLGAKQNGKALAIGRELEQMAPGDPQALNALAEALLANNDRQSAIATLQRAADATNGSPDALVRIANALMLDDKVTAAYSYMRKAWETNPGDARVQAALVEFSTRTDTIGGSITFARDLAQQRPDDPAIDDTVGQLYEADGSYEKAIEAYAQAFRKDENSRFAQRLAHAQAVARQTDAAAQTLSSWLERRPDDADARLAYAMLLEGAKRVEPAIAEYEQVLAVAPRHPVVLNNLAWLYFQKGDKRAVALAQNAYALAPQSPVVADTFGWILLQNGETARATEILRAAAADASAPPVARYHLAAALSKAGQRDQAKQMLSELLRSGVAFDEHVAARQLLDQLGG
jgi:putative PEP-CTERM system TPR-repeat lipoprotein